MFKGFRPLILILSLILLMVSSGLLFYKNLFLIDSFYLKKNFDFEELRYIDLEMNAKAIALRKNFNKDPSALEKLEIRLKEILNIIGDESKKTPQIKESVFQIKSYFDKKTKNLDNLKKKTAHLLMNINALNPTYNELNKNKIKFVLDNKDFYRECIVDALFYFTLPNKENEAQLIEDKKILGQVLSYANTPNPIIQKFSGHLETILLETKEIDLIIENIVNDSTVKKELYDISRFYQELTNNKTENGNIFLSIIFGIIVLYLVSIIMLFKKITQR